MELLILMVVFQEKKFCILVVFQLILGIGQVFLMVVGIFFLLVFLVLFVLFLLVFLFVILFLVLLLILLFEVAMPFIFIGMTMIVAAMGVPVVVIVFIDHIVRGVHDVVFFILMVGIVGGVGKSTA